MFLGDEHFSSKAGGGKAVHSRLAATQKTTPATASKENESKALVALSGVEILAGAHSEEPLLSIPELKILQGQPIVLTGHSGSGKSLLLSLLAGTTSPALTITGKIERNYQRCGIIPQRGIEALHPLKKISRQLQSVTRRSRDEVFEALAAVGLNPQEVGRRRPAELSGGQAQRVAIALAVLTRAELILADEPTSALDQETRDQTLELLFSVLNPDQTLVLTTHDAEVAQKISGRRIRVHQGQIEG